MRIIRFTSTILAVVLTVGPAYAGDKPPLEKTYATTPDKAYSALLHAAGPMLVTQIKEECMVNFKFTRSSGQSYTTVLVAATCKDVGGGKVTISLVPRKEGSLWFGGGFEEKGITKFWKDLDHELIQPTSATSPSPSATVVTIEPELTPFSGFSGDSASESVPTLPRLLRGLGRYDCPASVSAFDQGGGS